MLLQKEQSIILSAHAVIWRQSLVDFTFDGTIDLETEVTITYTLSYIHTEYNTPTLRYIMLQREPNSMHPGTSAYTSQSLNSMCPRTSAVRPPDHFRPLYYATSNITPFSRAVHTVAHCSPHEVGRISAVVVIHHLLANVGNVQGFRASNVESN